MHTAPQRSVKNTVAFLLGFNPGPFDAFTSQIVSGLLTRLYTYQSRLLFYGQPYHATPDGLFEDLYQQCDGVIFIPPSHGDLNDKLLASGMPVVAIADRAKGFTSVMVDDDMGAFMLAEHLSIRGHRRVMYRKDLYNHESAVRRYGAFDKAARYLGMEVVASLPANHNGTLSAEEETCLLLPDGQRPTAIVSWADVYSYPVLKFCKHHDIEVPRDLAVAGFDGLPVLSEPARRLTTIQAPWQRVAEKAVDLLMQMCRGEQVAHDIVFPVDLVIGDTT